MHSVQYVDLGLTRYASALEIQRKIFTRRVEDAVPDILLLNEHHHVYTLGRGGDDNHLLAGMDELRRDGIDVCDTDRGGDITYHGPGQIVGYPIMNLAAYYRDLHRYLRDLEEVLIRTCADFGVRAHRDPGLTGVWVGQDKIAAIGVKVAHWVTMHGFAFNVSPDLTFYNRIIPCGIFHRGVTSLELAVGSKIQYGEVADRVVVNFGDVFSASMVSRTPDGLRALLHQTEDEVALNVE